MTASAKTVATESTAHGTANLRILLLQKLVPIAARLFPKLTAKLCLRLFLTPSRHKTPNWEHKFLIGSNISQIQLGDKLINLYQWGNAGPKVMMCHGWSGRGSQMGAFAEPLVKAGFTVYAFDAPAHGRSSGTQTDMMEYAEILAKLITTLGPIHAVIGHSFGAANVLISKNVHRFAVDRIALLSCFSSGEWVIDRFAEFLNIPAKTLALMKNIHERRHGMTFKWSGLEISEMVKQEATPILFIHDRDDKEVPYYHAEKFSEAGKPNFNFLSTEGLGHRRILRNSGVVRDVCAFVAA